MEQQGEQQGSQQLEELTKESLVHLIKATYSGNRSQDIAAAENRLKDEFETRGFLDKLFALFVQAGSIDGRLRLACATFLKKYSFQLAQKKDADHFTLANQLFWILVNERDDRGVKVQLGTGLQHLFNQDETLKFKTHIVSEAYQLLAKEESHSKLLELTLVFQAYLNSLVETEDQIRFFEELIDPLSEKTIQLLQAIPNKPIETDQILKTVQQVAEFLETVLQRIIDEEQIFPSEVKAIQQRGSLIKLIDQYLQLCHDTFSLISSSFPAVNHCKAIVLSVIHMLYGTGKMPQQLFRIIYSTFLFESRTLTGYNADKNNIICDCADILEEHLQKKLYYNIFVQQKLQTLLAIFMYSVSTPEEIEQIEKNPEVFVEIAEEYTQFMSKPNNLKCKVGCLLAAYAMKIDQIVSNVLEIVIFLSTSTLNESLHNNEQSRVLKEKLDSFGLRHVDANHKVQTSLMMLSVVSPIVNCREDLSKVVYALFITHLEKFSNATSPVVILRIIRALGYYPTSLYYGFIKRSMGRGRAFILQGFRTFQKILLRNKYPEIFAILNQIFIELVGIMSVTDRIFQMLVLNHHDRMLKNSPQLYRKCLSKIRDQFELNLTKNQKKTIICFNLLCSLLKKEKEQQFLVMIQSVFCEMEALVLKSDVTIYRKFEEKLIQFYYDLQCKSPTVSDNTQQFALRCLSQSHEHYKGSLVFKFFNELLVKFDNNFKIGIFYRTFLQEIHRRCTSSQHLPCSKYQQLDAVPYFCFLLGQIIASYSNLAIQDTEIILLFQSAKLMLEDVRAWVLAVILHLIYVYPGKVRKIFSDANMLQVLLQFLCQTEFTGILLRKVFLLGMSKWLESEEKYFKDILMECIKVFKKQGSIQKKIPVRSDIPPKMRRMPEEFPEQEQAMQSEENDNELVNLFVRFKHPFLTLSEYDQFKIRIWQNDSVVSTLSPPVLEELKEIMETDWHYGKLRRILQVKKPNHDQASFY